MAYHSCGEGRWGRGLGSGAPSATIALWVALWLSSHAADYPAGPTQVPVLGVLAQSGDDLFEAASIVCTCRCCYQGGCRQLQNQTWAVSSCRECSTAMCNSYIASVDVRAKTARLFEGLEIEDGVSQAYQNVDECEVISVLEAATCTSRKCRRTTTIQAECYNRNAPLVKFTILAFAVVTFVAVLFGLIKDHIPAFQGLNQRYFAY